MDGFILEHLCAAGPGMLQQRLVEQTATNGNRPARHGNADHAAGGRREYRGFNLMMRQRMDLFGDAKFFKHRPTVRIDDIPTNLVTRESGVLKKGDVQPAPSTQCGSGRAARPATDHDHVEITHDGRE